MQEHYKKGKNMENNSENNKFEKTENPELIISALDQLEKISKEKEKTSELSPRDTELLTQEAVEKEARKEVLEAVKSKENKERKLNKSSSKKNNRSTINKKERNASYKKTLKQVQVELPASNRIFSKIIHLPAVEKASDIIGDTIARPNAILSGSFFAFVLTLITYLTAKNIGYRLSGFETIIAFILGWLIGIIYDYFKAMVTGKKM